MDQTELIEILIASAPIIFIAVYLLIRLKPFSSGGLKGLIYGSPVKKTFRDIDLGKRGGANNVLRVHQLENGEIVVEQSSKAILAASVQGFPMQPSQALQLIQSLQEATNA